MLHMQEPLILIPVLSKYLLTYLRSGRRRNIRKRGGSWLMAAVKFFMDAVGHAELDIMPNVGTSVDSKRPRHRSGQHPGCRYVFTKTAEIAYVPTPLTFPNGLVNFSTMGILCLVRDLGNRYYYAREPLSFLSGRAAQNYDLSCVKLVGAPRRTKPLRRKH